MLATLGSYENWLGPYHPQTLFLLTQVAIGYWQAGDSVHARPLLERIIKDLGGHWDGDDGLRLRAVAALRDLLIARA